MSTSTSPSKPEGNVCAVFKTFLTLGLTAFGGPIAHLGYFRKELVEKQAWISDHQFGQLLAICQFLPGPASSQLGFVLGMLRAGWLGALAAFIAFTLPSALLLIGFAYLLPSLSSDIGEAFIHGLKLVAFAVVADAVWGMSKKLCPDTTRRLIAIATVALLLYLNTAWSQIVVILGGALIGLLFCRTPSSDTPVKLTLPCGQKLGMGLLTIFFMLLALTFTSSQAGLQAIAQAFYQAGALVFGGGHVVLPLLEDAVVTPGWLSNEQFLAGYGASQAIPGPMFAFSAYLGALIPTPNQISWAGATTALVFMFLPGFLLVTSVLPFWQSIANNPKARNAIAGVNAAVVGLLAAALYQPIFTSSIMSLGDLLIALIGLAMLMQWRLSPLWVVVWCVVARLTITFLF